MTSRDDRTPQASNRATQDMQLVQALTEARRMAEARPDSPAWRELNERTDRLLRLSGATASGGPVAAPGSDQDRIDRTLLQVDAATAAHVAAALMALAGAADDAPVRLANEALAALETDLA